MKKYKLTPISLIAIFTLSIISSLVILEYSTPTSNFKVKGLFDEEITRSTQAGTLNITVENIVDKTAGDELVIDTGEVSFGMSLEGLRIVSAVTNDGESVLDAGFSLNYYRFPLWNWLTKQYWPGELAKATFEPIGGVHPVGSYSNSVTFGYSYIMNGIDYNPADMIPDFYYSGVNISQVYTFYADKSHFDLNVIISNPTNQSINLDGYDAGGSTVGFTSNWCGWIGSDSNDDFYTFKERGEIPYAWNTLAYQDNRRMGDFEWLMTYDSVFGLASGIRNHNATVSYDEWPEDFGNELRMEFPTETLLSGESIAYPLTFYAGKMENTAIEDAGFTGFMDSVGIGVNLDIDKWAYGTSDQVNASFIIKNFGTTAQTVDKIELLNKADEPIFLEENVTIPSGETYWGWQVFSSTVLHDIGKSELKLKVTRGGTSIQRRITINVVDYNGGTLYPVFLWHLHNPTNYDYEGVFTSPWPLLHAQGAYKRHWEALEAHPGAHVSINIVPILLYQWWIAQDGWNDSGTWTTRATDDLKLAIQKYGELSQPGGPLEITTTPYSHPILPLLLEAGFDEDAYRQMEMGKNFSETILGTSVRGTWLPEQSFSMDVIPVLNDTGIAYTVVNKEIMLQAEGMDDPLLPYIVRHPSGKQTIVLAEDPIGDQIAFGYNRGDMKENARRLLGDMINIYQSNRQNYGLDDKVLPIALDGENWMIMGGSPNAHELLFNFYAALEEQQQRGWIQSLKLSELEDLINSGGINAPVLTNVPDGSWADKEGFSFSNWRGEIVENDMWKYMVEAREFFYQERSSLNATEELELWRWLMNAESSDWAFYAGRDEENTWAAGFGADLGQFTEVRHWADHLTASFDKPYLTLDWTLLWPFLSDPNVTFDQLPSLYYIAPDGSKKAVYNFDSGDTVYPGYGPTLDLPTAYSVEAGSSLVVPFAIQSRGGAAANNVKVTIVADSGLTLLNSSTTNVGTLNPITFQTDLAYGILDMYIANWEFNVSSMVGEYDFTVLVTADAPFHNFSQTFTVYAAEPELDVVSINIMDIKNKLPGESGELKLSIRNGGIVDAENVSVSINLPEEFTVYSFDTPWLTSISAGITAEYSWTINITGYYFGEFLIEISSGNMANNVSSSQQIQTGSPVSDVITVNSVTGELNIAQPELIYFNITNTLNSRVTVLLKVNESTILPTNTIIQFDPLETKVISIFVQGTVGGSHILVYDLFFATTHLQSDTASIFIVDNISPVISNQTWTPDIPTPNDRLTLSVMVEDPSGIYAVTLKYRLSEDDRWTTKPMSLTGENIWSSILGPFPDGETIYIEIEAEDNLNNVQVLAFTINLDIEVTTTTTTTVLPTTTSATIPTTTTTTGDASSIFLIEVLILLVLIVPIIHRRRRSV